MQNDKATNVLYKPAIWKVSNWQKNICVKRSNNSLTLCHKHIIYLGWIQWENRRNSHKDHAKEILELSDKTPRCGRLYFRRGTKEKRVKSTK